MFKIQLLNKKESNSINLKKDEVILKDNVLSTIIKV